MFTGSSSEASGVVFLLGMLSLLLGIGIFSIAKAEGRLSDHFLGYGFFIGFGLWLFHKAMTLE